MVKKKIRIGILSISTPIYTSNGVIDSNGIITEHRVFLEKFLEEQLNPYFAKKEIEISVEDIGHFPFEVFPEKLYHRVDDETPIRKTHTKTLESIAKKLKRERRKYDQILVLGGGHHAAWPLYHLPGKVAYVDRHADVHVTNLNEYSYLQYIICNNSPIKKASKIVATGQTDINTLSLLEKEKIRYIKPIDLRKEKFDILDTDVDVFPSDVYSSLSAGYSTSSLDDFRSVKSKEEHMSKTMRLSDLGEAIRNAKPKVVGLFEINPKDKKAEKAMKALIQIITRLSVFAAAKRKFGDDIFKV